MIYIVLLRINGVGGTWYRSCLCFSFGGVWYLIEHYIDKLFSTHWNNKYLSCLLMFIVSIIFVLVPIDVVGVNLLACEVSAMLFCVLCVAISYRCKRSSKILLWISLYTYEIYLIHGCLTELLQDVVSKYGMLLIIFPLSLIGAVVMHNISITIMNSLKNSLNNKTLEL